MTTPVVTGVTTPVVFVTGLSGAGKASTLRVLEDLGYEAVDNLPLTMLPEVVRRGTQPLALGIDIRTRGFDAKELLALIDGLRADPAFDTQLLFVSADSTVPCCAVTPRRAAATPCPPAGSRTGSPRRCA